MLAPAVAFVIAGVPLAIAAAPLHAGDHVSVSVFNHPELTLAQATIDGDGQLALPLVGNVEIAGYEPDIAAAHISMSLKPYLRKPVVTLSVLQQNSTISIVGGPQSTIAYVPGQTLSSVVATLTATPGLNLHQVRIIRANAPDAEYDAADLLKRAQPGPALQPGDQIILAQNPVAVDVTGVVKTPGMAYLQSGATINDAVNAAGGATDGAATGSVDVLRAGQHLRVALSSDAAQQPAIDGDVITVPQAVHVAVGGQVAHPGDVALTNGTTLIAAIYNAGGPLKYSDLSHTEVEHDGVRTVYDITRVPHGDVSQNPHLVEGDLVNVPEGKHVDVSQVFGAIGVIHWFW